CADPRAKGSVRGRLPVAQSAAAGLARGAHVSGAGTSFVASTDRRGSGSPVSAHAVAHSAAQLPLHTQLLGIHPGGDRTLRVDSGKLDGRATNRPVSSL